MLQSRKIWLFTAVLLCLACVMLFHWSQGRAQQNSILQEQLAQQAYVLQHFQPYHAGHMDSGAQPTGPAGRPKLSEYWIGLDGTPADDVLRAQLDLAAGVGVVVNQVVSDSPAANAGLKQYDVLIAADDKPVGQISELADFVQQKKETTFTLRVVRAGKPQEIAITAQRRPATQTGETCPSISPANDAQFARQVYLDLLGQLPTADEIASFINDSRPDKRARLANALLRRSTVPTKSCIVCHAGYPAGQYSITDVAVLAGADPHVLNRYFVKSMDFDHDGQQDLYVANSPLAVSLHATQSLPDDVTITITRKGKEPARIEVRRGEQLWGTVETKLHELPEEIRGFVQQFVAPTTRAVTVQPAPANRAWVPVSPHAIDYLPSQPLVPVTPPAAPAAPAPEKPAESTGQTPATSAPLDQVDKQLRTLTQELEQLRKVIDELRKSPAGQPPKPEGEQ